MFFVCPLQENVDPALQKEEENQPMGEQQVQRRELRVEDEQDIWRDITLTQYENILRAESLFLPLLSHTLLLRVLFYKHIEITSISQRLMSRKQMMMRIFLFN